MSCMTCCVSNCMTRLKDGTSLHRFPDPDLDHERFQTWIMAIGGELVTLDPSYVYKNRRICDQHFNQQFYASKSRLTKTAIPTLHLSDVNHELASTQSQITSYCIANSNKKPVEMNIPETNTSKSIVTPMSNAAIPRQADADQVNKCEICLETCENANYSNSEHIYKDVMQKIYSCYKIVITLGTHSPSGICNNCIETLNIAYDFRHKCLNFEKRFSILCDLYRSVDEPKLEIDTQHSIEDNYVSNNNAASESDETETRTEDYRCSMCNKVLKSKESLLRHNVTMHQKRKHLGKVTGCGESRLYHCTKCSYHTPHSQTLVNHMRRHNGERPYLCECGKSFTQSASLAAHRKTHSTTTYYTCATCGKQFKHAFTLKKHLLVHEPGKYCCDICHKTLKSAQSLQDHKHRHYNIKNYNCEDCGDTFVTCSELINHKKKHSSVKEIRCQLCTYKTHTKKNLVIHLKRHTGEKSIKCGLCELTFYTSGDLRRHLRVHTREKPFACPTCAQKFTHSTSLNKHIHNVHGLDYKWEDFKFKELTRNKNVQLKIQTPDNK